MPGVGEIGHAFTVTVTEAGSVRDISGASTKNIVFGKSNGTSVTKTGTFVTDGTDGKLMYVSIANDLDVAGRWQIQASLVISGWTGRSAAVEFDVDPVL